MVNLLIKGRKLPEGSIRKWGGIEYQKLGGKWKPIKSDTVNPKGNVVEKKSIKELENENRTTAPKVPIKNVFKNDVENLSREQRSNADAFIDAGREKELPTVKVNILNIIPTQKNLTIPNLEKVSKIKDNSEIEDQILLIKNGSKYYVVDGHHRIANEILNGNSSIDARVYDINNPPSSK